VVEKVMLEKSKCCILGDDRKNKDSGRITRVYPKNNGGKEVRPAILQKIQQN
jgi:hypothetical protein